MHYFFFNVINAKNVLHLGKGGLKKKAFLVEQFYYTKGGQLVQF